MAYQLKQQNLTAAKVHMTVPAKWCHNPSAQRQSSVLPPAKRWLSVHPLGEVGNILYGGPWGLNCQVGTPKGHSSHRGSDGVYVSNPHHLILHNATQAHHCYGPVQLAFLIGGVLGVP